MTTDQTLLCNNNIQYADETVATIKTMKTILNRLSSIYAFALEKDDWQKTRRDVQVGEITMQEIDAKRIELKELRDNFINQVYRITGP